MYNNAYCSGKALLGGTLANGDLPKESIVCVQHCTQGKEKKKDVNLKRDVWILTIEGGRINMFARSSQFRACSYPDLFAR